MNTGISTSKNKTIEYHSNEVSLEELEQGMVNAARLVRRYGAIYWPIVERLQSEIDVMEKREALIAKLLDGDATRSNQVNFG
ncbi:MAG: hypothetical protein ABJN52_03485 [Litorimonas sp.]